jgi:hypothetical protein
MQSECDDGSRRFTVAPRIDKGLAHSPTSAMSLDSDTQAVQDLDDGTAFSIPDTVKSRREAAVIREEGSDMSDDLDEIDDEDGDPGEDGQKHHDLDEGEVRDDQEISDEDEVRDEDEDTDNHMLSDRALSIRALTQGLGLIYDEKLACLTAQKDEPHPKPAGGKPRLAKMRTGGKPASEYPKQASRNTRRQAVAAVPRRDGRCWIASSLVTL